MLGFLAGTGSVGLGGSTCTGLGASAGLGVVWTGLGGSAAAAAAVLNAADGFKGSVALAADFHEAGVGAVETAGADVVWAAALATLNEPIEVVGVVAVVDGVAGANLSTNSVSDNSYTNRPMVALRLATTTSVPVDTA